LGDTELQLSDCVDHLLVDEHDDSWLMHMNKFHDPTCSGLVLRWRWLLAKWSRNLGYVGKPISIVKK